MEDTRWYVYISRYWNPDFKERHL